MLVIATFLVVILVVAGLGSTRFGPVAAGAACVITLALIGLVTWTVFGADDYAQDGLSRWSHRGSPAHDLYIASMTVAGVLGAVYAVLAARRVRGPVVSAAIVVGGVLEAFGVLVIALAFSSN